jgi:hypothetical protein
MKTLPKEEVAKLPYVEIPPNDGRILELRSYYDHEAADWILYLEVRKGELGRIAGGEVVTGSYFAARAADPDRDFPFRVSSVIAKHLSFPGTSTITSRLESDLHQMAAILGKYNFIVGTKDLSEFEKRALLETEIEYAIGLCRSFFDLLQGLIRRLGRTVRYVDSPATRSFNDLPDSFARVVLDGDRLRDSGEIGERWGLFPKLSEFYARQAEWFQILRTARDGVFHHGKTVPSIFLLPEGAALHMRKPPWKEFPIWNENTAVRGELGSARAFLAHIIEHTINASDEFLNAFLAHIAVPRQIGPHMNVFVRGAFSQHLLGLNSILGAPWEGDAETDPEAR